MGAKVSAVASAASSTIFSSAGLRATSGPTKGGLDDIFRPGNEVK